MRGMAADVWRYDAGTATASAQRLTRALVEACHIEPASIVLDIACGGGNPSLYIASEVATRGLVVATDIDRQGLSSVSGLRRSRRLENLVVCSCAAGRLPFPAASFDAVTCRFGVMFFPDIRQMLDELYRVLRPGARLAFAVFGPKHGNSLYALVEAALEKQGLAAAACSRRLFSFSDRILVQALAAAGFRDADETEFVDRQDHLPELQLRHVLRTTYSPVISELDDSRRRVLGAELRARLAPLGDACVVTHHFRVVHAER